MLTEDAVVNALTKLQPEIEAIYAPQLKEWVPAFSAADLYNVVCMKAHIMSRRDPPRPGQSVEDWIMAIASRAYTTAVLCNF